MYNVKLQTLGLDNSYRAERVGNREQITRKTQLNGDNRISQENLFALAANIYFRARVNKRSSR